MKIRCDKHGIDLSGNRELIGLLDRFIQEQIVLEIEARIYGRVWGRHIKKREKHDS